MQQTKSIMEPCVRNTWIARLPFLLFAFLGALSLFAQADAPATTVQGSPEVPNALIYALVATAVVQVVFIVSLAGIIRALGTPSAWRNKLGNGAERLVIITPVLLLASLEASAQAYKGGDDGVSNYQLFWVLLVSNIFLFIILMVQINLVRGLTKAITGVKEAATAPIRIGPTWDQRIMRRLTRQVAVEKEQDILMHHEYDGIRELDNVLPPWWVWLFYGTIAWSVLYLVNTHVIAIWPDQKTEYQEEMAQANAEIAAYKATLGDLVDENTVTLTTDAGVLSNGKSIFTQYCTPCHGADASGSETSVGPNLTDAYWLHGGGVKNVFKTITYGVPAKGMISWKTQLKPAEIAALASYILSLQGSGSVTQKAPQGDLWKEEVAPADSTAQPIDTLAAPKDTARLALQ